MTDLVQLTITAQLMYLFLAPEVELPDSAAELPSGVPAQVQLPATH